MYKSGRLFVVYGWHACMAGFKGLMNVAFEFSLRPTC